MVRNEGRGVVSPSPIRNSMHTSGLSPEHRRGHLHHGKKCSNMELNHETHKITPLMRLGRRVRHLREERGLSIRQLCEQKGIGPRSHSHMGRIELGQQLPSEELVKSLDKFFGADGMLIEFWEMASDEVFPDYTRKVMVKEPEAERIQVFNGSMIPALLQTRDYIFHLFRRSLTRASEEKLNELLASRLRRQKILDYEEPPYYWAIMDESALKRTVGDAAIMVKQLQHVLLRMDQYPHIVVQVLPFSAGAYPLLGGSLTLHTLQRGGNIAGVESFASGDSVESPKKLAELTHRFDLACSMSLTVEESAELIREYLRGYENELSS